MMLRNVELPLEFRCVLAPTRIISVTKFKTTRMRAFRTAGGLYICLWFVCYHDPALSLGHNLWGNFTLASSAFPFHAQRVRSGFRSAFLSAYLSLTLWSSFPTLASLNPDQPQEPCSPWQIHARSSFTTLLSSEALGFQRAFQLWRKH